MVPGALLGMAVCLSSRRDGWFRRAAIAGFAGAIGWSFGGSMSYGNLPAYTVSDSFPDVCYGYGCLFVVGALWGGVGGAILALAFTESRSTLQQFVWPIVLLEVAWLVLSMYPQVESAFEAVEFLRDTAAFTVASSIVVLGAMWLVVPRVRAACGLMLMLAAGWWLGQLLLVKLTGFHMQPKPGGEYRSDAFAGCAGLLAVLLAYHYHHNNRAGIMLTLYGLMAGGLGFAIGNFINIPDKVRWEPFWRHEFLRGFDHWKWTEQSFGLIMGAIVALGAHRLLRGGLSDGPEEARPARLRINELAAFALLAVIPWSNLYKNVVNWTKQGKLTAEPMFGLPPWAWILILGAMLSVSVILALYRYRQNRLPLTPASPLGKGQLLFLFLMWVTAMGALLQAFPLASKGALFVHWSFWFTCALCTLLVMGLTGEAAEALEPGVDKSDRRWNVGLGFWCAIVLSPALIALLSVATMKMQTKPDDGALLRFGPNASHLQPKT